MTIKESISTMLDQLTAGDSAGARDSFQSILADKIGSKLENMRVDIATSMFNGFDETAGVNEEVKED